MPRIRPNFTKSPFFVEEPGNWYLEKGAPKELQAEFEDYLDSLEEVDDLGTINGNKIEFPYNR